MTPWYTSNGVTVVEPMRIGSETSWTFHGGSSSPLPAADAVRVAASAAADIRRRISVPTNFAAIIR